jgi:hypothetical protein
VAALSRKQVNDQYQDWLSMVGSFVDHKYDASTLTCPGCGRKTLLSECRADPKDRIGYILLWCEECDLGIRVSRVEFPTWAKIKTFTESMLDRKMFREVSPAS